MSAFVQPFSKSNKLAFGAAVSEGADKESNLHHWIFAVLTVLSALGKNELVISLLSPDGY